MSSGLLARLDWHGHALEVDYAHGRSIAIPLDPHGPQPSFFTDRPAGAKPLRSGDYIGAVNQGGSCNAEVVELVPHCHGTHTECIGHLLAEPAAVQDCIDTEPVLARLVSLEPKAVEGRDWPEFAGEDLLGAVADPSTPPVEALVIRSLPNDPARRSRDYAAQPDYPVLSRVAMTGLAASPLRHLLVDSPSLDPAGEQDMSNHRAWWGLGNAQAPLGLDPSRRSVTEMIYAPDDLSDGLYWLHLELSPLLGDATPSRPMLYPLRVLA